MKNKAFGWHVRKTMFLSGLSDGLIFEIESRRSAFYWMGAFTGLSCWSMLLAAFTVEVAILRRIQ